VDAAAQYEFDPGQNALIGVLAKKMLWVAYFSIGAGLLLVVAGVVSIADGGMTALIQAPFFVIIGIWTKRAAVSFQRVVTTEGSDVTNLMAALGELKKLYTLQYWLILLVIALIAFAVVVGTIAALAM